MDSDRELGQALDRTSERERERQEARTEQLIRVRQVTDIQASWTEADRGEPGAFTLQLILDNGVAEYILRPTAEDLTTLLMLFRQSGGASFDLERQVLMFSDLPRGRRGAWPRHGRGRM